MKTFNYAYMCALCAAVSVFSSCVSPPSGVGVKDPVPTAIMGRGVKGEAALVSFFLENNRTADSAKVRRMSTYYIEEGKAEGINSDIAFAQMCLETGFLSFRGIVTEDMNNFCGLGSIGPGQSGNAFPDERTGVRAHIQHLKAYASPQALVLPLVDPRYKYVNPKGKAPTIHGLAGTWASDRDYGAKLEGLLSRLFSQPGV
jgi:hypothetical protein